MASKDPKPLPPEPVKPTRTLGPIADLERHLPSEWWKSIFNALYLKTDGDVVENDANTENDINVLLQSASLDKSSNILDLCCGQGRHLMELANRGFVNLQGIDRSRYLITLARKRAKKLGHAIRFSEGDARMPKYKAGTMDCVTLMGNSFGYFEREEDDVLVLKAIKNILKPSGHLVLDIVNGPWMKEMFEPRSWEWIDKDYFVCRERALDSSGTRIISRELISHAEQGVIADQFYAERLYSFEDIEAILDRVGFLNVTLNQEVASISSRNQDLGMMGNRLFISARVPSAKKGIPTRTLSNKRVNVVLGDPRLNDTVKMNGQFNPEDMITISRLKENLGKLSDFEFRYYDRHESLMSDLLTEKAPIVFNLCDEGFNNHATQELHVPALLEMLNIPYTGSGPATLAICYNKAIVQSHATSLEIPVPLQTFYDPLDQAANLPSSFPALLKPNIGDNSIGITQGAVVNSAEEILGYINYLNETLPKIPILIQEFLTGPEYSVGIIGNTPKLDILPILEVDYSKLPERLPKILSYESKWDPKSDYWSSISYKEAQIDEETRRALTNYSVKLFEHFNCRDYARFDFRADQHGQVKLLEINPNPGWCWDGKLNIMAGFAGISYQELLESILKTALERYRLI